MKINWLDVIHNTHKEMMDVVTKNFGVLVTDDEWIKIDQRVYEIVVTQVMNSQDRSSK